MFLLQGGKNGVTRTGNEYFSNAVEEQNKASELVGYIFPVPLILNEAFLYTLTTLQKWIKALQKTYAIYSNSLAIVSFGVSWRFFTKISFFFYAFHYLMQTFLKSNLASQKKLVTFFK